MRLYVPAEDQKITDAGYLVLCGVDGGAVSSNNLVVYLWQKNYQIIKSRFNNNAWDCLCVFCGCEYKK